MMFFLMTWIIVVMLMTFFLAGTFDVAIVVVVMLVAFFLTRAFAVAIIVVVMLVASFFTRTSAVMMVLTIVESFFATSHSAIISFFLCPYQYMKKKEMCTGACPILRGFSKNVRMSVA